MKSALSDVLVVEPLLLGAGGLVGRLPGVVHLAGRVALRMSSWPACSTPWTGSLPAR